MLSFVWFKILEFWVLEFKQSDINLTVRDCSGVLGYRSFHIKSNVCTNLYPFIDPLDMPICNCKCGKNLLRGLFMWLKVNTTEIHNRSAVLYSGMFELVEKMQTGFLAIRLFHRGIFQLNITMTWKTVHL